MTNQSKTNFLTESLFSHLNNLSSPPPKAADFNLCHKKGQSFASAPTSKTENYYMLQGDNIKWRLSQARANKFIL